MISFWLSFLLFATLSFSLIELKASSSFRSIGAGGSTFSSNQFLSGSSLNTRKFFNVARVRGGSKESRKLIKLFNLVNEKRKLEQRQVDAQNLERVKAAQPKQFKFEIVQHISGKQKYIGRYANDYFALFFPEPRDLVDKDIVYVDERLISNGGSFEYFSNNPAFDTSVSSKRTIRTVKILKETDIQKRIVIPELIDGKGELNKQEFVNILKNGENFQVKMEDEVECGNCVGGYRVIKTSSLQRDRVRCGTCQAKGKVLKEVDFNIIWDLSLTDIEGID